MAVDPLLDLLHDDDSHLPDDAPPVTVAVIHRIFGTLRSRVPVAPHQEAVRAIQTLLRASFLSCAIQICQFADIAYEDVLATGLTTPLRNALFRSASVAWRPPFHRDEITLCVLEDWCAVCTAIDAK